MPEDPSLQRIYRIRGRVQGVGFRWWTRREAQRFGVSGDVQNLPDGSVQVRARGPGSGLAAFAARLREGPPGARVTDVQEGEASGVPHEGFHIAHGDE